jgi:hypothetical protein
MKDKLFRYYTELPTWAKGVVVVTATGAVALVGYRIYKALYPSQSEKVAKALLNSVKDDIQKLISQGLKPSFSDAQYQTFATTIWNGMKSCADDHYGDVELTLKKMKNNLDVALLIQAYGTRTLYCFGIPSGTYDMMTAVRKELGNEWGGLTDYRVKSILADWQKKGITYTI